MKGLITILIVLFFSINSYAQNCEYNYSFGKLYFSNINWSCPITDTIYKNNDTVNNTLKINGISNNDTLVFDLNIIVNGDLIINSAIGSNPLIYIPFGDTLEVNGDIINTNNNVMYYIDGFLIVNGTLEGKNNHLVGGSGIIMGDSIILHNNTSCAIGGCPTLYFDYCYSNNNDFCDNNNNILAFEKSQEKELLTVKKDEIKPLKVLYYTIDGKLLTEKPKNNTYFEKKIYNYKITYDIIHIISF